MTLKKIITKNQNIITLTSLALFVILLRLPSLFEPNRYADEDIYLTLGQGLRKGLVFYRDIHDNKPPLLYLLAAIAGNVPMFRLILLFWHLINVYLVHLIGQKLFQKRSLILITTFLFAFFSSIPLTEGNIANGEIFMIMPTTLAILLILKKQKYFLIGCLFAVAFLFKVPAAFEFFGLIFWFAFYQQKNILLGLKKVFSPQTLLAIAGFAIPIVISIIYYYTLSAGQPYVKAALLQNVGYLSSWEGGQKPFYQSGLIQRGAILIIILSLIYSLRHKIDKKFGLIVIWFSTALFGALLSGRPYPHYFIQIITPAVFLLVLPLKNRNALPKIITTLLFLLTLTSIFYYKFWHYKSLPYYKNFIHYQLGHINQATFYRFWGDSVIRNYQIAQYIKDNTDPDQNIFVWGTQPAIYALADRLPVGRYTVSYHIADFRAHDETIAKLQSDMPPFIIYFPDNPPFPALDQFISRYYIVDTTFPPATIFRPQK